MGCGGTKTEDWDADPKTVNAGGRATGPGSRKKTRLGTVADMLDLSAKIGQARGRMTSDGMAAQANARYHRPPRSLTDDYVLSEEVLGSGMNGDVRAGHSKIGNKKVAIKAFRISGIKKHEKEALVSEVAICLKVDHPHVCRLYDVYEQAKQLDLVMECLTGGELFGRVLKVKRYAEKEAADAARQMLMAVSYLHDRKIVHRDLKLHNFVYESEESETLKLIDFGLSTFFKPGIKMWATCGTLSYLAPEVLKEDAGGYDNKCDIWSLGVCVYILLVGYLPFHTPDQDTDKTIDLIIKGNPRENGPKSRWNTVTDDAKDFIDLMFRMDPEKRPSGHDLLKHRWITAGRAKRKVQTAAVESLVQYSQASTLRKNVMLVMAWSLSKEERAEVAAAFSNLDGEEKGTITKTELAEVIKAKCKLSEEQMARIIDALASHGPGDETIHYSDFLAAMVSTNISVHADMVMEAFNRFDVDRTGFISADNLMEVLDIDEDAAEELLQEADFSGEGQITLDDFREYITGGAANEKAQKAVLQKINEGTMSLAAI